MIPKGLANWLRIILGLVIALALGIDSYFADRGAVLTYVLPLAIGLLAIADLIGFLCDRADDSKRVDAGSPG